MNWLYNEFQQVGRDYADKFEVQIYNETHSKFRDLKRESLDLIAALELSKEDLLVDFGSGTGVFAIEAAQVCKQVFCVDISEEMLAYSQAKADKKGITNMHFVHSGFLNFRLPDNNVSCITSTFSFHHLPDFWKKMALVNMNKMLQKNGKLYIKDVIIEEGTEVKNIDAFIQEQAHLGGTFLKEDAELHFREEFSTYDWIFEELLRKAGFTILEKKMEGGVIGSYFCCKAS